jgi:NADH-quinone oxidoreductase subunit M
MRIYLLLMNRLYLDALSIRLGQLFTRGIRGVNSNRRFSYVTILIAVGLAMAIAARPADLAPAQIGLFFIVALLLPLFPLHGIYVAALTRSPGYQPVILAALLPAAGLYGLANLLPDLPSEVLRAVGVLALFGALYGSLKALAQVRVAHLLAYAGLAFFSVLWWLCAVTQSFSVHAVVYVAAVALLTGGLLLACQRTQGRYGYLTLDRMHGLARPMPRFGTVVLLLVMAAVGLPPFGLFSAYMAMLLGPAVAMSWGLVIILTTWFLASWYLFRMMQRLLFGPYRADIRYEDLRASEVVSFAVLLVILAVLGTAPPQWLESDLFVNGHRAAVEMILWHK